MFEMKITDSAADRIKFLSKERSGNKFLRISVNGGGCSGFKYDYVFVQDIEIEDAKIEHNGAIVLVDKMSQAFLEGVTLDYIQELGAAYFKITNPNAAVKCGCGNSFGV